MPKPKTWAAVEIVVSPSLESVARNAAPPRVQPHPQQHGWPLLQDMTLAQASAAVATALLRACHGQAGCCRRCGSDISPASRSTKASV